MPLFALAQYLPEKPFPLNSLQIFSSKTAQKTLVKPKNHSTPSESAISEWHFSYIQTHIIKLVDQRKQRPRPLTGANSFRCNILMLNPFVINILSPA
jgi:hypothetical protein